MRNVVRPCADCGTRVTFRISGHVPNGLALLCTECWRLRARDLQVERSRKQQLRKPTDRRRPAT
jgi:hypothetical protein